MTRAEKLAKHIHRTVKGPMWHGPSLTQVLEGFTHDQAAAHPIAGAHSVWELVLHLTSDFNLVLRRMAGDGRPLTADEGWPECPSPTEDNWRYAVLELERMGQKLRQAIRVFPDERLDERLVSEVPYTAYTQFIGVTQHQRYHAGQIALLKRALTTGDFERSRKGGPGRTAV